MSYITELCGSVFGANAQELLESHDEHRKDKTLLKIKEKIKLIGWGGYHIVGYINGHKYYKVKLHDGTLITMEKNGRVMHILQDKTRRS